MFIYECSIIDHWTGWQKIDSWILDVKPSHLEARKMLTDVWEQFYKGKIPPMRKDEMYYTGTFPFEAGDCDCQIMVGWKEDDNGTTYIAAPHLIAGWRLATSA